MPEFGSEFVGSLEADATDVVSQLIRVLLDFGDGLLPIGAVDSHRPPRRDAMLRKKEHDFANFLLFLPAFA